MRIASFLRRRRPAPPAPIPTSLHPEWEWLRPIELDEALWRRANPGLPVHGARRTGKRAAHERMVAAAVELGEHVHVASPDPETGRTVLTCPLEVCTRDELTRARNAMTRPTASELPAEEQQGSDPTEAERPVRHPGNTADSGLSGAGRSRGRREAPGSSNTRPSAGAGDEASPAGGRHLDGGC